MGFLDLFSTASMPVLKVLLITALGSFLALDHVDIMGESARKHVNKIVFFVFNPALVGSNLARTITFESFQKLWFMPVNVLLTFILGSVLGWILLAIVRPPSNLKGLILGSCAAGNMGNLPMIIIPAVCKEKGSPFGDPNVCHQFGMAYASLSMALGAILLWTYVYNIVRFFSITNVKVANMDDAIINIKSITETDEFLPENLTENLLPSNGRSSVDSAFGLDLPIDNVEEEVKHVTIIDKLKQHSGNFLRQVNIKALFAPSAIGALTGFVIGTITPFRKLMIGGGAPLRVIQDSAYLLGDAAIPCVTLVMGGNLLKGLKVPGVKMSVILGIIAVRYIFLPVLGIIIIKGAISFGLIHSDPLYQFVLLLQYALPPAMNIGTITQLFGSGESECSTIMLWTYSLASVSLTLWSTFFMWLVSLSV